MIAECNCEKKGFLMSEEERVIGWTAIMRIILATKLTKRIPAYIDINIAEECYILFTHVCDEAYWTLYRYLEDLGV